MAAEAGTAGQEGEVNGQQPTLEELAKQLGILKTENERLRQQLADCTASHQKVNRTIAYVKEQVDIQGDETLAEAVKQLRQERDALRQRLDAAYETLSDIAKTVGLDPSNQDGEKLFRTVERLRQRAEEAEAACAKLRHFIKGHDWDCAKMVSARDEQPLEPCNCGFEELDKPNPGAPLLAYIAKLEAVREAAVMYRERVENQSTHEWALEELDQALAAAKEAR